MQSGLAQYRDQRLNLFFLAVAGVVTCNISFQNTHAPKIITFILDNMVLAIRNCKATSAEALPKSRKKYSVKALQLFEW
jgi:hypothetical protein